MSWIKSTVGDLVRKYKTNDPFELASFLKVKVVLWDLHEEINGFYKYDRKNKYIYINSNLNGAMQRFVCGHELGHAVLHPRANTPFLRNHTLFSVEKIEVEANRFAVDLLIPDEALYDYDDSNLSIHEICEQYSVPKELAHIKKFNN
ncbi:ImmA/IrrE family metallo-endopeptidase [Peribacillus loiseleuriae]|uniref:ImmA/IrrE family metallo-endopeptidase n=1 Tax=Peribacillus loiseleuriae TaxID=1679170 RepID=UPI003D00F6D4